MKIGGILPGPEVSRCPHCNVLLRGVRKGTKDGQARRQRNDPISRPKSAGCQKNTKQLSEMIIGGFVILVGAALTLSVFIGGGATLGWFVLIKVFSRDAAVPLAVAGGLFGALLLHVLCVLLNISKFIHNSTRLISGGGESDWLRDRRDEIERKEHKHQLTAALLRLLLTMVFVLSAGSIAWKILPADGRNAGAIVFGLVGLGLALFLVKRWDDQNAPPSWAEAESKERLQARMQQVITSPEQMELLTHALSHPDEIAKLPTNLREIAWEMKAHASKEEARETPPVKVRARNRPNVGTMIVTLAKSAFWGILLGAIGQEYLGTTGGVIGFLAGMGLGYIITSSRSPE